MQKIHLTKNRQFLSIIGILFVLQFCLYLQDHKIQRSLKRGNSSTLAVANPKKYFISELAPLFANQEIKQDESIINSINQVLIDLDIKAYVVADSLSRCDNSVEFLVYVYKYKRAFPVRYTPLINNLAQLITQEKFSLEIKAFSSWMPLTIERLLG